jgi:general stress protein YciG
MNKTTKDVISEHYKEIGKKGGKKTARRGSKYYREIGKKGLAKRYNKVGKNPA